MYTVIWASAELLQTPDSRLRSDTCWVKQRWKDYKPVGLAMKMMIKIPQLYHKHDKIRQYGWFIPYLPNADHKLHHYSTNTLLRVCQIVYWCFKRSFLYCK